MKRLPLLILALLLTVQAWGQSATPPLSDSARALAIEYGIELEALYPGSLVAQALDELLKAAQAEATETASRAYDEGYKAALLSVAPELAASEARAKGHAARADAAVKERDAFRAEVDKLTRWLYIGAAAGGLALALAIIF